MSTIHPQHHPELLPDEVFVCNAFVPVHKGERRDEESILFPTRAGRIFALDDPDQLEIAHAYPLFAKRADIVEAGCNPEDPLGFDAMQLKLGLM